MTRAEQETIIRWDRERPIAYLCTASALEAARWRKKAYAVRVLGFSHGKPRSWECEIPLRALILRRLPLPISRSRPPSGGRRFGENTGTSAPGGGADSTGEGCGKGEGP